MTDELTHVLTLARRGAHPVHPVASRVCIASLMPCGGTFTVWIPIRCEASRS